ncbi:MAG: hypothetical protein AB8B97_19550, partial [Granulosicoccus sp.]
MASMVFNMITLLKPLLVTIIGMLRSMALLHLEILALRQQLAMIAQRDRKKSDSIDVSACSGFCS